MLNRPFERKHVPSGKEICEKQLLHLVDKMEKVEVNEEIIAEFLPAVYKKLEALSREDLIKQFVSAEFNRFLSYYRNAPDINVDLKKREDSIKAARHAEPLIAPFKRGKFKKRQVHIEYAGKRNNKEKGNKKYAKSRAFSSPNKKGKRFFSEPFPADRHVRHG